MGPRAGRPRANDNPLRPAEPSKPCSRSTTSRPTRARTSVDTPSRRCTWSPTLTASMLPPGTATPVRSCGVVLPSSVLNDRSTRASSGNGLNTESVSDASLLVAPSAKYQGGDGAVAHGATLSPAGPRTTCSTTTCPPSSSTVAEANGAAVTSPSRTRARVEGSTPTGTERAWPWDGKTVTWPVSRRRPKLATTSVPSAGPPLACAVAPVQYQAVEVAE